MTHLLSLDRGELAERLRTNGFSPVHADLLFKRLYRHAEAFRHSTDLLSHPLPRGLSSLLGQDPLDPFLIKDFQISNYDGTVKFQLECIDQNLIEAVLIPEQRRMTLCVSSQIGCAQACTFCHTGRMGLKRNLAENEIVGQVRTVSMWMKEHPAFQKQIKDRYPDNPLKISNLVFMGMGEPLDNLEAVVSACKILSDPLGFALPQRKISISTAGLLENWEELIASLPQANLAISLHAASDRLRSQLMPIHKKSSLTAIKKSIVFANARAKSVLVQYTLFADVNDKVEDAEALANFLQDLDVKVNLIPYNEVSGLRFKEPEPETLYAFAKHLHNRGLRVLIRFSKGQDIAGACGQLFARSKHSQSEPSHVES